VQIKIHICYIGGISPCTPLARLSSHFLPFASSRIYCSPIDTRYPIVHTTIRMKHSMPGGYFRFPTVHGETIVFVAEDDLWSVNIHGGVARRFTSNVGDVTYPIFSPDGSWLAFVGREEGASEIYVMPAQGGSARRLTYLSSSCRVLGWTQDGQQIIFSSNYGQVASHEYGLFTVTTENIANCAVTPLSYGPAQSVAFGPGGRVVIGRNMGSDPARWKRYRGGTAGHLWIDRTGDGQFMRFLQLRGNLASPMWLTWAGSFESAPGWDENGRIFFASDHEGVGNLYSCRPDGDDLRRHTDHEDYYVRNPTTDGSLIVYHVGADLYVYQIATDHEWRVPVDYHSPRVQRNRKFVDPARYFDNATLHPSGRALALTTRGKLFAFYNHDGPILQLGKRDGVRYRLPDWLHDGRTVVALSDELGEETLELHNTNPDVPLNRLEGLDLGRAVELKVSPTQDKVAIANHRHELLLVDLPTQTLTVIDHSPYRLINGFDWSPDGRWLAYACGLTTKTTAIRLYHLPDLGAADATMHEGSIHTITKPVLHDVRPAFDPDGGYLYFLSHREFNPVYDGLHFDLGFPWGMRPYLVTLRADLPNPFTPRPDLEEEAAAPDEEEKDGGSESEGDGENAGETTPASADDAASDDDKSGEDDSNEDEPGEGDHEDATIRRFTSLFSTSFSFNRPAAKSAGPDGQTANSPANTGSREPARKPRNNQQPIRIDLEDIEQRVIAFPVPDGRYGTIAGVPGKAIFSEFPIHGSLSNDEAWDDETPETGTLRCYNFKEYKTETLVDNVQWFAVSRNRKKLLYGAQRRLRVVTAGEKPPNEGGPSRRTGWVDLGRVKVSVDPQSEWEQMFREAWRLQRDHFWTEDMLQIDWQTVYQRYFPLIERVSTRSEFSDLMWEMQGELGTSHAYEYGGDYRARPYYSQGFLGTQFDWDPDACGYRVGELITGDSWKPDTTSPLAGPGVDVQPGDLLLGINGQRLSESVSPAQLLVNQAGQEVLLTFAPRPDGANGKAANKSASSPDEPGATTPKAPDNGDLANGNQNDTTSATSRTRSVVVRAIHSEAPARYRAWVEDNRQRVHEASGGRVGYVHVPDMVARGYAEFHRGYLAEVDRDALIVDVRYNSGGHVSQLILEKLARRRIGYDLSRWSGLHPYPSDSVAGPIIALTNEHAGSDGDIFCHSFKLLKLGPLIGKRTWGGVVGISPRHALVDGTVTTQPEYSFWFADVGWNVENYGTDPDIEVDITPQDYMQGEDPQLGRAIAEVLRLLVEQPPVKPDLAERPNRALPRLPPRQPNP
jgi:tricorn protease